MDHSHQLARYDRLLAISRELNATYDLDELLVRILRAAAEVTNTELASVMLIDESSGELNFRAAIDENGSASSGIEGITVPLDGSLAGWVVTHGEPLLVADAQNDPRWYSGVDSSTEHVTRSLATAPLRTRDKVIGAVQVINKVDESDWDEDDIETLVMFANQAAIAIQTARFFQTELRQQKLEQELDIAHRIQMGLIPDHPPQLPGWDIAAYYRPANQVGGDFYDFFRLQDDHTIGLVVADVSDKGIPAAIYMAMSRTVIRATGRTHADAAETLRVANNMMVEDNDEGGVFVTVFYAQLDPATGHMSFSNGGHNHPIWWQADSGEITLLQTRGALLGIFEDIPLEGDEISVQVGDVLVFYTDGVTEAMNIHREEFLTETLCEVVDANANQDADAIVQAIVHAVDTHAGAADQFDDITLFVVKRLA